MSERRIQRLNSLLKQVISDVILKEVKNPHLTRLLTITNVEITKDLQHAKVFVSVIGEEAAKKKALSLLQASAGFIAVSSSKQVVLRTFPQLTFVLDESVDRQIRIETLITRIQDERASREGTS